MFPVAPQSAKIMKPSTSKSNLVEKHGFLSMLFNNKNLHPIKVINNDDEIKAVLLERENFTNPKVLTTEEIHLMVSHLISLFDNLSNCSIPIYDENVNNDLLSYFEVSDNPIKFLENYGKTIAIFGERFAKYFSFVQYFIKNFSINGYAFVYVIVYCFHDLIVKGTFTNLHFINAFYNLLLSNETKRENGKYDCLNFNKSQYNVLIENLTNISKIYGNYLNPQPVVKKGYQGKNFNPNFKRQIPVDLNRRESSNEESSTDLSTQPVVKKGYQGKNFNPDFNRREFSNEDSSNRKMKKPILGYKKEKRTDLSTKHNPVDLNRREYFNKYSSTDLSEDELFAIAIEISKHEVRKTTTTIVILVKYFDKTLENIEELVKLFILLNNLTEKKDFELVFIADERISILVESIIGQIRNEPEYGIKYGIIIGSKNSEYLKKNHTAISFDNFNYSTIARILK